MWRKLVVVTAVFLALIVTPVSAGITADVTITAIPNWGITSFTATVISDTQVDLVWTFAPNVSSVMIRAKYGSEPVDETDGYLVYSGTDTSISDTSMNFDENVGILYYAAFGETEPGVYGASAFDDAEGTVMLLLTLMGASLILTVSGYISKRSILAVMGGLFWIIVGVYAYTLSSQDWAAWDIYLALAFGCLMFSLVGIFAPVITRDKSEDAEDVMHVESEFMRFNRDMQEMNSQLHVMSGGYQPPVENQRDNVSEAQNYIERTRNKTLKKYRGMA